MPFSNVVIKPMDECSLSNFILFLSNLRNNTDSNEPLQIRENDFDISLALLFLISLPLL